MNNFSLQTCRRAFSSSRARIFNVRLCTTAARASTERNVIYELGEKTWRWNRWQNLISATFFGGSCAFATIAWFVPEGYTLNFFGYRKYMTTSVRIGVMISLVTMGGLTVKLMHNNTARLISAISVRKGAT